MRYERRSKNDGTGVYYSFVTSDRKRLSKEEIRNRFGKDITTEDEAKECLKLLEAKDESVKMRIQKRLAWEKEFYGFAKLLEQYEVDQKKSAPNSWQNNVFYLKHYVLHYFLQVKKLNNIESWSDHFDDFRAYLETAKTIKQNTVIAYQSKNHAIKSLNTFLFHLEKKKIIERAYKCETFEEHLMNTRTIDDVIFPEEMEIIYDILMKRGHKLEALLFRYFYDTGGRWQEGLGLSLANIFQGEIDNDLLSKKMKAYEITYYGYIVLESQLVNIVDGKPVRAPFKGRKVIAEKYNRIQPITDKVLWNHLVEIAEAVHKKYPNKLPGDCLIFEGVDDTTASRRLESAFIEARLRYRSWHCLRHSKCTWLIGLTGDSMLARIILGITSPKTLERYNHIYQAISRAAKSKQLTGKKFGLKKV